ncbi:hypothetical protein CBS470a_009849 [Colletotrichum nupharicola]|nr:hypothetical protein CBS470a_009849 [Colletotrichum nupharicola]
MSATNDPAKELVPDVVAAASDTNGQPPAELVSARKQSWSDIFTIACAGFALISDGYQNNLMTMTNVVLKAEYPQQYTSVVSTRVSNSLLIGEIIGQVTIGLTCDYLGRKFAIILTTALIVLGSILATAASGVTIDGMFWMMTVARGIIGFGAGGEYPASSTSASEAANEHSLKNRGPIFILVTNLPLLVIRYYWKRLIGTAGAWFLYDFVTFPNGVFSGVIISSVVKNSSIKSTAEYQLLLGAIGLPGVLLGAYLCDRIGRKNVMMLGFSGYLVFGLIIGVAYDQITKILPLFVVFYGLMQSSGNMGPGDMLGLLSSESYATAVRGTCYGLSAAVGKAGAAIGTQAFTPIQASLGKRWTFIIAAICGVVGVLVTYFFVPNLKGDDLSEEDARFHAYLLSQGWDGEVGEKDTPGVVGDEPEVGVAQEGSVKKI